MPYLGAHGDDIALVLLIVGGLCAAALKWMAASTARGWTKLSAFLLIGSSLVVSATGGFYREARRTITPADATGALVNLHTVTSGYRSSPTQHYNVATADSGMTRELHDEEALFFMSAQEGEDVELKYTRESGYVTQLKILSGRHAGFQFVEPDVRNMTPFYSLLAFGIAIGFFGIFKWIVDRRADPGTGG